MTSNAPFNDPNSEPESSASLAPETTPDTVPEAIPAVEPDRKSTKPQPRRIPSWRFWVPLVFQSALIVAIPAQDAYTSITGTPITLQTVPVDPYDLLRGYSQTLSYTISRPDDLKKLPGGKEFFDNHQRYDGASLYVVLEAPQSANTTPPTPWKPVRVSAKRPTDLADNQVVLRGEFDRWQVIYGLETYYMPEDQRNQLNAEISQAQRQPNQAPRQPSQAQQQQRQAFVVDVKVDAQGNSVPVSLWVRDRNYRF